MTDASLSSVHVRGITPDLAGDFRAEAARRNLTAGEFLEELMAMYHGQTDNAKAQVPDE